MMREKPIIFSGPMVRAILEGRKTQTRRIVHSGLTSIWDEPRGQRDIEAGYPYVETNDGDHISAIKLCPFGVAGDRLWVREKWAHVPSTAYRASVGVQQTQDPNDPDMCAVYAANWERCAPSRWRPSIHMPRWASRITLGIKAVRVERLNQISEADAVAEGVETIAAHADMGTRDTKNHPSGWIKKGTPMWTGYMPNQPAYRSTAVESYSSLWESIHGAESWAGNPWVWVVEFEKIENSKLKTKGEEA